MFGKEHTEVDIFLRLPNGNGWRVKALSRTTLSQLAEQLKKTSLHLPQIYRFVIKGQRVKNYSMTLQQLRVTSNCIIHIEPIIEKQIKNRKIDVALLLRGDKVVVNVSRDQTVWGLKKIISNLTGINPKQQSLFFLGKKLKNQETLKHYKVDSDSLISFVYKKEDLETQDFQNQIDLVTSVCSLGEKKSGVTKTSLFRSDSINKKNIEEIMPYEISIKKKEDRTQKQHLNELFKSYREEGLKASFTFNSLFESVGLMQQNQSFEEDSSDKLDDLVRQEEDIKVPELFSFSQNDQ